MTVVVGIRCKDGVVIGTDSAMTFVGSPGQQVTIEQPYREKIEIIDDRIVVAGTGAIGLGQRFIQVTRSLWQRKALQNKDAVEIGRLIAQETLKDFASTNVKQGQYGALVAVPRGGTPELIEFDVTDFQPEVKTDANWYASMGAGQTVADPLLGFIRKAFWGDDPPSRQDGIFAATMVLGLACEMAPFGVAPPIQMAVLAPGKKGQLSARLISEEELLEHQENVNGALNHLRTYRDQLRNGAGGPAPPAPPSPSPEEQ